MQVPVNERLLNVQLVSKSVAVGTCVCGTFDRLYRYSKAFLAIHKRLRTRL